MTPTPTNRPWLLIGVPLTAAILSFMIVGGYFLQKERYRQNEQRLMAYGEAATHTGALSRSIDQATTSTTLVAAVLSGAREWDYVAQAARLVLQQHQTLSAIEIAPEGVVRQRFGRNAAEAMRTIDAEPIPVPAKGRLHPYGSPLTTSEDQRILISQAVHQRTATGEPRFWGYVHGVIELGDLASAGSFNELVTEGYDYALHYRKRGDAAVQALSASNPDVLRAAIVTATPLPNGDTLELSVVPRGGWGADPFLYAEMALVLVVSVLFGIFLNLLLRWPERLRQEVQSRTRELSEANAALQRSHALLDSIFEHLPLMLVLKRADDLRVARVNHFGEMMLGRPRNELVDQPGEALLPAGLADRSTEADYQALIERRIIDLNHEPFPAADGERTINLRKVPLFDKQGRPEFLLDVIEDVTERHALAASIARQVSLLESFIDAIPAPTFFIDEDGRFVNVNRAFERFFGHHRDDLGKLGLDAQRALLATRPSPSDRPGEVLLAAADGVDHPVVLHATDYLDEQQRVAGTVGIIVDLSEQKAAEKRIHQLNRTYQVLSSINETIVRVREEPALLERACEILVEQGLFPLVWVYAIAADTRQMQALVIKGSPGELAQTTLDALQHCPDACNLSASGSVRQVTLCDHDAEGCANRQALDAGAAAGYHSIALLPIRLGGDRDGGIAIFAHEADFYTDEEIRLLADLADDLTHALAAIDQDCRRRAAEADLRLAAQVFENSAEGIMITDASNRILMVNKAFSEVTGYAASEVLGQNPRLLSSGKQDPSFYREMWTEIQRRGEWHGEVQNRRKSGEHYAEWLTISAVRDAAGQITNYVAVFTDITSTKQIEERLNYLANYDTLTNLPNRVLFNDRLEQALVAARLNGKSVALMFLDLDRFNLINESFGHSAGDLVLKDMAMRLKANVRKGDSVSRMGGDEFSVVLPDLDSPDEAAVIAANIMHALGQPLHFDGRDLFISASIGISVFPEDGGDAESLVKNADSAMYRAMEEGRNTFCFYHQEMNARSSERMSMESSLRKALERGELVMHYQPFVDARSGRIVGAEALLRWKRPEIGYITPAAFIPLLEETGLIVPVGEWVLETACRDNQAWRDRGYPDLFVAVNFSALQLVDPHIATKVGDTLARLNFNPRHLEIELTESMVMKDAERGIRTLNEFRQLGTLLSVDDFGTGYSSLSYLKRLPIDTLKIDRSFVMDTPGENEANAIVQAIIALGHSLDLKIIAEGVQDAAQVDFLRQVRCDLLQGYFFSTAVEHGEFMRLLDPREQHWNSADWTTTPARRLAPVANAG